MAFVNVITLPQELLDRVERVLEYHRSTAHVRDVLADGAAAGAGDPGASPFASGAAAAAHADHPPPDPANQPYEFRVFEALPRTDLPQALLDPTVATLSLLDRGMAALPAGQPVPPPQDMRTLATWLHYANGIASRRRTVTQTHFTRTCFSDGEAFPCELYVAAFAVAGLEPGFYHYSPREFALRKLRDGQETLARLTRGRPDLMFLRTVPAALMVSTIYCRSTWRFGKRGYRHALLDAGHMTQNLVTVAGAVGIQTFARMHVNDSATRELIGLPLEAPFSQAESVQAMVVWADHATCPMERAAPSSAPANAPGAVAGERATPGGGFPPATGTRPVGPLPAIDRSELANEVMPYVSIIDAHQACVAPGQALREVRPPQTETMPPMPADVETFATPIPMTSIPPGEALRTVLLTRQASRDFAPARGISRAAFFEINRLTFRGGTFFPMHPDGPHVALVRPFWAVHGVAGMESGLWYYHPPADQWTLLRTGAQRREVGALALDQPAFARSAATCFLAADFWTLMLTIGPDIYRLAHLEAGIITNRIALATEALDLGWFTTGSFYDEECRHFLGLRQTPWEILSVLAIGSRIRPGELRGAADAAKGSAAP